MKKFILEQQLQFTAAQINDLSNSDIEAYSDRFSKVKDVVKYYTINVIGLTENQFNLIYNKFFAYSDMEYVFKAMCACIFKYREPDIRDAVINSYTLNTFKDLLITFNNYPLFSVDNVEKYYKNWHKNSPYGCSNNVEQLEFMFTSKSCEYFSLYNYETMEYYFQKKKSPVFLMDFKEIVENYLPHYKLELNYE